MSDIIPMGRFLATDQDGFFLNDCSIEKISSPWKETVEEIRRLFVDRLGSQLHSIYIRGSVARGGAVVGVSDIDAFAIVKVHTESLDLAWLPVEVARLEQAYPFASGVDLEVKSLDDILSGKKYFYALAIQVMAVCVWGEDLAPSLRSFKPDLELARSLHGNLETLIQETTQKIEVATDSKVVASWCSFIMKRLVRSGCAILIETTHRYSRDLYPCYEIFSRYYPEKSGEMYRVLELAVYPTSDKAVILKVLGTFGEWMVGEVERLIVKHFENKGGR